jgi:hydroxyacylglutathione hydrolase
VGIREEVMQVSKHVHALKIPFQVMVGQGKTVDRFVYVYLIYGTSNVTLIDCGVSSSETNIIEYLKETGRKLNEISMIVLTHAHPDHIGAARAIKKATGCNIAAHQADIAWIEDVERQSRERPVPAFHSLVGGSVKVDYILKDGDMLDCGDGLKVEVLHTPGHSKGAISLLLEKDQVLFSGDAIPVPGDMPIYDDVLSSISSIKRLKAIAGIKLLLSSWDEPREGQSVYQQMDESLRYLQSIHKAALEAAGGLESPESMQMYERFITNLGFPQLIGNPLVERTFQAHLKIRDHQDLLRD